MTDSSKIAPLPRQFTSFIGRNRELSEINQLLVDSTCRLLTVIGPGGIGKTRLVLELIPQLRSNFSDGIFFVNLQPVFEATFFISALADALEIHLSGDEPPLQQLARHLTGRSILLVLDNFEQLLTEVDLVSKLLYTSDVCLLITSREPLGLAEEWLYPLTGLGADEAAVSLFAQRARRVQPRFSLEDEREGVETICRLVDGIPLAIELAATWARMLSAGEIGAEIRRNLDFLSTSLRNIPERHRSMAAVFEQTWNQLDERQQAVFQKLTVFRGGFRREAAQVITGADLSILSAFVDKSLLRWEEGELGGRYQIHELLRQFGEAKLLQNPSAAAETRISLTTFYADHLFGQLDPLLGGGQLEAMVEIESELENIRVAWSHAIDTGELKWIDQIARPMVFFFWYRSRFMEAQEILDASIQRLKELPSGHERDRVLAYLLTNQSWFLMGTGEIEVAFETANQSQILLDKSGLKPLRGLDSDPRLTLGIKLQYDGQTKKALALYSEALEAGRADQDRQNWQTAARLMAEAFLILGQYENAREAANEAYHLARGGNDLWGTAYCEELLGDIAWGLKQYPAAKKHFLACLKIRQTMNFKLGQASVLRRLGLLACENDLTEEGLEFLHQSLDLYRQHNLIFGQASVIVLLARLATRLRRVARAYEFLRGGLELMAKFESTWHSVSAEYLIEAGRFWLATGYPERAVEFLAFGADYEGFHGKDREDINGLLAGGRQQLDSHRYDAAFERGRSHSSSSLLSLLKTQLDELSVNPEPDPEPENAVNQSLIEPLTNRELEVLNLIAAGHTNKQIADELILSIGTVKSYTSAIYGKLGVTHRTQAVAHAREIGLI